MKGKIRIGQVLLLPTAKYALNAAFISEGIYPRSLPQHGDRSVHA